MGGNINQDVQGPGQQGPGEASHQHSSQESSDADQRQAVGSIIGGLEAQRGLRPVACDQDVTYATFAEDPWIIDSPEGQVRPYARSQRRFVLADEYAGDECMGEWIHKEG